MRTAIILAAIALSSLLMAAAPAAATTVLAENHNAFWIWGGVKPQPPLARAAELYILQGEVAVKQVGNGRKTVIIAQGMDIARLKNGRVWLVYRADTLRWTPQTLPLIIARLQQWQQSGNRVIGLQIDFDARTRHLHEYAKFLRELRHNLPAEYRLGITGLLDWHSTGDVNVINGLKGVVDEIAIQTYQGRRTIGNYQAYLPALKRLTIPFRIGLLQHGEWQAPEGLEASPWFRGYVVFLQNRT